jgi:hypothetical protein
VFDPELKLGERVLGERPSVSVVSVAAERLSRYKEIGRWDQKAADPQKSSSDSGPCPGPFNFKWSSGAGTRRCMIGL